MELYDLVEITNPNEDNIEFKDGIGIITNIKDDLVELLFIGKKLNELSKSKGGVLFTENEIEGI